MDAIVVKGRVEDRWNVPGRHRRRQCCESDGRPRQRGEDGNRASTESREAPRERLPEPRPRPADHEERRSDRQEQHMLEHVHGERGVRVGVDRGVEGKHDHGEPCVERDGTPTAVAAA